MKSIKTIRSLVLLLMLAAACSKHDDITPAAWNGEICLSSEISSQVKTRASDVSDRQIAANQTVSFFVDDAGTNGTEATPLYGNYLVTADGKGGFTKPNTPPIDMYYPATGNNVDIYAFQTNGSVGTTFPTSTNPLIHSVKPDQSTQYGNNYLNSDLLYAASKGVKCSNQPVSMNFYHLLSKVEVALKAGVGAPNLTGAVVTIENTRLKANFLPVKSADINHSTSGQTTRAAMITLPDDNSNPTTPIALATAVSNDFSTYASAVVVPQAVAQNSHFIKVTLASGVALYYTLSTALNLASGNKYQFQITVNLTGLTVRSSIADWTAEMPSNNTAEMPPPVGSKDPATAAIGDFYFSDGTLEDKTATLTDVQKAACIGIVFKMGKDTKDSWKDDCDYKTKAGADMPTIRGYVLALYDANSGNYVVWASADQLGVVVGTNTEHLTGFYGYKNTNTIKAFATTNSLTVQTAFPATYYATDGYEALYPAPAGSSGWFLPSGGQGQYWFANREVLLASVKKATNNSNYDWKNYYWLSSEHNERPGMEVWNVMFCNTIDGPSAKNYSHYVRSIFAF